MSETAAVTRQVSLGSLARSSFPWLAILYAALFCAFGTESPFFPSFLASRSLSTAEIGLVLSVGTVARLTTGPLLGMTADRFGTRLVLALAAICAGAIGFCYVNAAHFWPLLAVLVFHSIATGPLNPLADALALAASARETIFSYGWVRGVGSASFVLGTLVSGEIVAHFGLVSIIIPSSILYALMAPPILGLTPNVSTSTDAVKGAVRALLKIAPFRRMLVVAGLVIGSHAMCDAFAVIEWRHAGIGDGTISVLWSESVVSEVAVFTSIGPYLLRRLGPARCAVIAAIAGVVRWTVMAATADLAALAAVQLLHGLTFSLMHLACMQIIRAVVPEQLSATAQTLYGTLCLGLASAVLTLASGEIFDAIGYRGFFIMAALCVVAIPPALMLPHRQAEPA